MRFLGVLLLVTMAVAGCGGNDDAVGNIAPVFDQITLTPQGTAGFVEVGATQVQINVPAGAVTVPTTFVVAKVHSEGELLAPVPDGRVFVTGLEFNGAALNFGVPVQFRVPSALTLPEGTGVQAFWLNTLQTPPRFVPLLDSSLNPVITVVGPGLLIPFATTFTGQFLFVTVP